MSILDCKKRTIGLLLAAGMLLGYTPAFALERPEVLSVLRLGSVGEDVVYLQEALQEEGYYQKPITEVFDDDTRDAVIAFQADHDLKMDGVANQQVYDILYSNQQPSQPMDAPTATAPVSVIDFTIIPDFTAYLREGKSSGEQVKLLQQCLTHLEFFKDEVTGQFGSVTKAALVAFQKENRLEADGIAGPNTLRVLYDLCDVKAPEKPAAPTATPAPTPTPAPTTTPEPTLTPEAPAADPDAGKYDYLLKKGMTTSQVGQLQDALEELGYYGTTSTLDANFYFGDVTYACVRKFQADHNLAVDGIAGPATLQAIFTRVTEVELTPPFPIPSTTLPSSGIDFYRYDAGRDIPIETVDWWDGGSGIVPRGAYFTVVDVRTGYTFRAKRMGGSRHIDYETATQEDTAILYAIYGKKWSYDRRPVWIIYNGRRIAGSTNGQPHGQQTILDNGMEGQVCIHLLGSSTHGSMKVDAQHQACVLAAYNAGK